MTDGAVIAVAASSTHAFSKAGCNAIQLLEGLGVEGDCHAGVTVKHRSRVAKDPAQPNLRQVHLIHAELFDELRGKGFAVAPSQLGENITTRGIALLDLPQGSLLRIGADAVLEITGLRNPCAQIERFNRGLLAAVLGKGPQGEVIRKCGVMAIVQCAGAVRPGDLIVVERPPFPHHPLQPV